MTNKKQKIFIVEDDEYIVRAYKEGLENAGYEVLIASSGEEALEMINSDEPDLILLDLIMPKLDGFEVLKRLAMNDHTKNIPVVILSNLGQDSDLKKVKELGAVDYLIKADHSMKDVIDRVKLHIAKSH